MVAACDSLCGRGSAERRGLNSGRPFGGEDCVFTCPWAEPEWDLMRLASFIQVFGKLQTPALEFSLPGYIKGGWRDIF